MRQPPPPVVLPEGMEVWPDNDPEDAPTPPVETAPTTASPAVRLPCLPARRRRFSVTLRGKLDGIETLYSPSVA